MESLAIAPCPQSSQGAEGGSSTSGSFYVSCVTSFSFLDPPFTPQLLVPVYWVIRILSLERPVHITCD